MAKSIWEMDMKDGVSPGVKSMEQHVSSAFNTMSGYEKQFARDMDHAAHSTDGLSEGIMHIAEVAAGAFAVEKIYEYGKAILETTAEFEGFENRIKFASGSSEDASKNLDYIGDAIHRLHLPMKESYEQFSGLEASMMGTELQGQKLRDIFEGLGTASSVLHLSQDAFGRAAYAIQEMADKGIVSTVQMTRQLAIAIPGAMNIAARAMHMSTAQFREQMEAGTVTAADFLPKFAAELRKTFSGGLGNAGNSLISSMNDTATALYEKQVEIGKELKGFYMSIMSEIRVVIFHVGDALLSVIHFLKDHWAIIKEVGVVVGLLVGWYALYRTYLIGVTLLTKGLALADLILFTYQELLAGATLQSALAMWGLNTAMLANPVFWLIGGVMALTGGIIYAWNHFEKFRVLMYALWATIKQVFSNIGDFFKMIFEPIFKAIDAFKSGNYSEAAKQVGLLAFNLTPVGLAVQTTKFAYDGGFTKGVPEAWAQGKKDGHASWAADHKASGARETKGAAGSMDKYNAAAGGAETGTTKGEGSTGRNITVTIQKIVGIENVHVGRIEEASSRAAGHVTEALIGSVRDFETGIAAQS